MSNMFTRIKIHFNLWHFYPSDPFIKSMNSKETKIFISQCALWDGSNMMFLKLTLTLFLASSALSLDPKSEFESFKKAHGKVYKSLQEEEMRFKHFQDNLVKIEKHNSEAVWEVDFFRTLWNRKANFSIV